MLNREQTQAVRYRRGPLLLIAGAGTGKTLTLVEKIAFLLKSNAARPEEILALTFTEKAAAEMEERVDQAVPYGYAPLAISTFHAFADRILKTDGHRIGLSPHYHLLTQAESIIFLRKNLFLLDLDYYRPLGNPTKFVEALHQHFSRLKDEDVSADQYRRWAARQKQDRERWNELARAYQHYDRLKAKQAYLDFADLVYWTNQLLRRRLALLKEYRRRFRFVLVDEFQDTNMIQYALIKLLCPPRHHPNLTVVGDDSQAIYKFRGASISNIIGFMNDYPDAKRINLQKNYRSNQTILDHAYRLIKNNDPDTLEARLGISKDLRAQKKDRDQAVTFSLFNGGDDEATAVAKTILSLRRHYRLNDLAILVRANDHLNVFGKVLQFYHLPYRLVGAAALLKQPEVKDLIAYLKLLNNLNDSVALYRVLSMALFAFDPIDLALLNGFCRKTGLDLFPAIQVYLAQLPANADLDNALENYRPHLPLLTKTAQEKLDRIRTMIQRHLRLSRQHGAGQLLYFFLEDSGYLAQLTAVKSEKDARMVQNIAQFFALLRQYEMEHEDASVAAVVEYLEMSLELGESPGIDLETRLDDAVKLLTVHGAKGLEFPVVFMPNLVQGRFPTTAKKEAIPIPQSLIKELLPSGDFHLQEERRLFYVGLTRAMDRVYLSASRLYGTGKRERKVSPFVVETLGETAVNNARAIKREEKLQLSMFNYPDRGPTPVKPPAFPTAFSYTQLDTFLACPLKYKYTYILGIPTSPQAALVFGTTIHQTLQRFYQEFKTNPGLDRQRLLEIYRHQWIPVGYTTAAQQKKMRAQGEFYLKRYFRQFHHQTLQVEAIEQPFKVNIAPHLYMAGKIDRIDRWKNNDIEIIDYKTGQKPQEKQLIGNLQLPLYALAVMNRYRSQRQPLHRLHLSFIYLAGAEKYTVQLETNTLEKAKAKIKTTVANLHASQFPAKVGPACRICPFRTVCEAW
ncbi:ATP-dependent helicase [Patescibacteria group bacterium]|nr:ATP-dependent helicase [Patescibacteria group bacterium]MCL5091665.1 ATP-dependent helicase [Patescibacteria group bacterium]